MLANSRHLGRLQPAPNLENHISEKPVLQRWFAQEGARSGQLNERFGLNSPVEILQRQR
jgi:hypothetical protein